MPCMKAKNQVILINSSFFVHFSFSQNKGKEKKKNNQPHQPHIQQSWNLILRKFHKKLKLN